MSEALTSDAEQGAPRPLATDLVRASRAMLWLLLTGLAILFLARRMTGGLRRPLPGEVFLIVVGVVELIACWLRWPAMTRLRASETVTRLPSWPGWMDDVEVWWRENRASLLRVSRASIGGALIVVMLVAALSLAGTGAVALIAGWLMVLEIETLTIAYGCGWNRKRGEPSIAATSSANQTVSSPVLSTSRSATLEVHRPNSFATDDDTFGGDTDDLDDEAEAVLPPDVVQQTTRTRLAEGGEAVEVFLRCRFEEADAVQVLHVAFCPPLGTKPEVEVDQLSGPEATVKTTLAETFGVRLEVRLAEATEGQTDVVLRLHAVG